MSEKTTVKFRKTTLSRLNGLYEAITSGDRGRRAIEVAGWDVKLNVVFDDYEKRLAEGTV